MYFNGKLREQLYIRAFVGEFRCVSVFFYSLLFSCKPADEVWIVSIINAFRMSLEG